MAVQTPTAGTLQTRVVGDLRMELARFTSVADADTYVSSLSTILAASADGSTSAPTVGLDWVNSSTVGATVTFKVTSGPALKLSTILLGY